jgi:hypothetical protein
VIVESHAPHSASPAPPAPASTDAGEFPAACASCGYLLHGLRAGPCPECGRPFDPTESLTHTYAGWFNPWLYWLPAVIACVPLVGAITVATVLAADTPLLIPILAAPAAIGLLGHYGYAEVGARGIFSSMLIGSTAAMLIYGPCVGHAGAFLALPPLLIGCLLGDWLRHSMKTMGYRQSRWLP